MEFKEEEKDRIERLKKVLYSRNSPDVIAKKPSHMSREESNVNSNWGDEVGEDSFARARALFDKNGRGWAKKLLIASVVFFVISFGFAAFMFFWGGNTVSTKNVDISFLGPVSISGGEALTLDVSIKNNNTVSLESANLSIEYPAGTRDPNNTNNQLIRQKEEMGSILPGANTHKTFKAVIFGEKGSVKEITVSLEYRVKGSSAVFSKEKKYQVTINSSPVIMDVSVPNEVSAGSDFAITLNVSSNSSAPVKNLLITADYPFGFSFVDANPKPTFANNIWNIGDLGPGAKRVIQIKGKMQGQDSDERVFRFHSGVASDKDEKTISADFVSSSNSVSISKPFIGLDLRINKEEGEVFAVRPGDPMGVNVLWTNNLPTKIVNAKVAVSLVGSTIDKKSVRLSSGGFYQSSDNLVIWDKNTTGELSEIGPGDGGAVDFNFASLFLSPSQQIQRNQDITLKVVMTGTSFSSDGSSEEISSELIKKVKLSTALTMSTKAVYSTGPFKNTGPIPPRAEKETTYTVIWSLSNSFNDVSGVSARAELPQYMKWLDKVSPTAESIVYDPTSRTITWNPGNIPAGTGFSTSARQVAFQVSLVPSISQIGATQELVKSASVSGTDLSTGLSVAGSGSAVTTALFSDVTYGDGDDKVMP